MSQAANLLFFWDYDTQWGADRSRTPGGAKAWGYLEFENTDRLLDLHAQYDIKACFAVVGAAALPGEHPYHDPQQIKHIYTAGHEIASHSFKHEWLPALNPDQLRGTLSESKETLERCIGAEVISFVPPFDMPMDYPQALSFNLTERREVRGKPRTDLVRLCEALRETGYQFCRVNYRPFYIRLLEKLTKRRIGDRPSHLAHIAGLHTLRTNTPPGFAEITLNLLEKFSLQPGNIIVYGHPHHLSKASSPESEAYLIPVFEKINQLRVEKGLQIKTPRDLITGN